MTIWFSKIRGLICLCALLLPFSAAATTPSQAALCDEAARIAAQESNVPLRVMRALTRTETGRGRDGTTQPWAWTVNMEGAGVWFDTQTEARVFVLEHFKRGARSFDIGCFQVNYKWHGHAFRSIEEMFNPLSNARYAAHFLAAQHQETGDWTRAAGRYHSRTAEHAARYRARFSAILAALPTASGPRNVVDLDEFPLLARPARLGSLVSLPTQGGAGFFRPAAPLGGG